MCGIVGYLGSAAPEVMILNGLKRLEYRGYDSAGISILQGSAFTRLRAEGKLKNLEERVKSEKTFHATPSDHGLRLGIGHTRWATHGSPTEKNAHPHEVGGVSIVHNGIIENYLELKEHLKAEGHTFTSDTDSEVIAHLFSVAVKSSGSLLEAAKKVLPQLKGAFSILVIWDKAPEEILALKDGPPLILGVGEGESFVVSDIQACIERTSKFIYLEDREVALVSQNSIQVFNHFFEKVERAPVQLQVSAELLEKKGFSHFMLKEIHEQPQSVHQALQPFIEINETPRLKISLKENYPSLFAAKRVVFVACGTSAYAGAYGKYLFEKYAKIPTTVEVASEFRYSPPVLEEGTVMFVISQSGETADTLASVKLARKLGVSVISLCNVQHSSIEREAEARFAMNAGVEVGVASTKAFSATLTVLSCLALALAQERLSTDVTRELQALIAVPSQMQAVLNFDKYFSAATDFLKQFRGFLYMGRGVHFPLALEGALKLKELAYRHAEGFPAGEMKHGPLALIDEDMAIIVLCPRDEHYEKTLGNLQEAKARGGQIISIGTEGDHALESQSDRFLPLPVARSFAQPLLELIPLQLMAFHLANALGHDVDQPRNLAKSVTVE